LFARALEATLAFIGVALVGALLLGVSRIGTAVHEAIREQTVLLYELHDALESHANRLRGLSQELAETAEVSPELKRSGRARRAARGGESARQKIR
jgi:hypothetical protein